MFGKKKQPPIKSLVAHGSRIEGHYIFSEGLRVDGEVADPGAGGADGLDGGADLPRGHDARHAGAELGRGELLPGGLGLRHERALELGVAGDAAAGRGLVFQLGAAEEHDAGRSAAGQLDDRGGGDAARAAGDEDHVALVEGGDGRAHRADHAAQGAARAVGVEADLARLQLTAEAETRRTMTLAKTEVEKSKLIADAYARDTLLRAEGDTKARTLWNQIEQQREAERIALWEKTPQRVSTAFALQAAAAKLDKINHLNLTPDLLKTLVQELATTERSGS